MKKKQEEVKDFILDDYLIQIFESSIETSTAGVNRAKQYLRVEELKLARDELKLDHYKKTGKILTEEELRKLI